jgi:hypothetical protein
MIIYPLLVKIVNSFYNIITDEASIINKFDEEKYLKKLPAEKNKF